jgi:hypothetical protein
VLERSVIHFVRDLDGLKGRPMRIRPMLAVAATAALLWTTGSTFAGRVDFSDLPAGSSVGDMAGRGIAFHLARGGSPVVAEEGGGLDAFYRNDGAFDTLNTEPASDKPHRFLKLGAFGTLDTLRLDFSTPAASVGGQIIDIDGTESWNITAYNASGIPVAQTLLDAGSPGAGDATATPWQLAGSGIVSVALTPSSQRPLGAALDNFTFEAEAAAVTTTIAMPLPPALHSALGLMMVLVGTTALRSFTRRAAQRIRA